MAENSPKPTALSDFSKLADLYLEHCDMIDALIQFGYSPRGAIAAEKKYSADDKFKATLIKRAEIMKMKTISKVAKGEAKKEQIDAADRLIEFVKENFGEKKDKIDW